MNPSMIGVTSRLSRRMSPHDANHRGPAAVFRRCLTARQAFADGALPGPEASRQRLVDDVDVRRAILVVAVLELTSLDEVDAGAAEVSRRHAFDREPRRARVASRGPSFDQSPTDRRCAR